MMKRILLVVCLGCLSQSSFAGAGFFDNYLITTSGSGNVYTQRNASTRNLGTFNATSQSLTLKGGQSKTFKNIGNGNICGPVLNYRIYKSGDTPGAFSSFSEGFLSEVNTGSSIDQTWENTAQNIDLITGKFSGTYVVEVYWSTTGHSSSTSACDETFFDSNSSANYKFEYTITNSPLPVVLKSFKGEVDKNTVKLSWQTTSEKNNSHFDLEKSTDLKSWEKIAEISGNGTLDTETDYGFIDEGNTPGIKYYRLKQVDFDQNYEYSKIISIKVSAFYRVSIYPNPSTDYVRIDGLDNDATAKLLTNSGREVRNAIDGKIDLKNLPLGKYLVVLSNGLSTYSQSIIVY